MDDKRIKKMINDLLKEIDYDIYKSYTKAGAECEPEELEENWQKLIKIVKKHIK
jgi:hypothetical protein